MKCLYTMHREMEKRYPPHRNHPIPPQRKIANYDLVQRSTNRKQSIYSKMNKLLLLHFFIIA